MTAAIMQPYFFPYIGYFQLIHASSRFILFDDVQYIRHGWINRNRILKPGEGFQYIIMPLAAHSRDTLIRDIQLIEAEKSKDKILRQIEHYKKTAPYYKKVRALMGDCFATSHKSVTGMNAFSLKVICDYIGIDLKVEISSQMNFDYSQVQKAGDWALRICQQLQAREYINPAGGMELFNKEQFEKNNIRLRFLQPGITTYSQRRAHFEPGLSIVDVMMFNDPAAVKDLINNYQLV